MRELATTSRRRLQYAKILTPKFTIAPEVIGSVVCFEILFPHPVLRNDLARDGGMEAVM